MNCFGGGIILFLGDGTGVAFFNLGAGLGYS